MRIVRLSMPGFGRLASAAALASLSSAVSAGQVEAGAAPCRPADEVPGAECLTLQVPEVRSTAGGRILSLRIARLPASARPARNALFVFQGGPGQAASTLARFYARIFADARSSHDIVLIDQRGTGGSNALSCPTTATKGAQPPDLFEPDRMRRCRARLERLADLGQYTTAAAVADAEDVRAAFGYDRIDIYGTSYGTRVAMEYARRHPGRVRTLILKGVFAPGSIVPMDFPAHLERSIGLMLRDCSAAPDCANAFPDLAGDLRSAAAQLEAQPATVGLSGRGRASLSRGLFGAIIRSMLQSTALRAELPSLLHEAAGGNWAPFMTRAVDIRSAAERDVASGMMLSVFCAEDVPFLDRRGARKAAEGTLLGTYWFDELVAACDSWPRGKVPKDWRQPFSIHAPTLLVSGYLDPATPPSEAEAATAFLANHADLVVPAGSHSFGGMNGCIDSIMAKFVTTGRLDSIDRTCAARLAPPPFKTDKRGSGN